MFRVGTPNLSEAERTRSPGVVVVYYADDEDYRCRWFSELDFFDAPLMPASCCLDLDHYVPDHGCCEEEVWPTFGEQWSVGEPVAVDADLVRDWYLPRFLDAMRVTREAPDEPPHAGYELYWRGELAHQEEVPSA